MMRRACSYTIFTLLISAGMVYGQPAQRAGRGMPAGTITGTIVEANKHTPMHYTNVVLFSQRDSVQIDGTITNENGKFRLTGVRPGDYFAEVTFIGFEQKTVGNITLRPPNLAVDLGTIIMESKALTSENIVVEGERPAISYQIDRKVIDASRFETAASGNAVDILENVPSVNVDIEGNVELRGSSNFRVLIDGKPTVLNGNDALQQIPASTIDDIEIITNPSVKYDPEGTTGIINLVLKKNRLEGMSGLVNTNAGMNNKYGAEGLVNYKNDQYTATLGLDYNKRMFPGNSIQKTRTTQNGVTSFLNSDGSSSSGRQGLGLRAALEYNFTQKDQLTLSGRYGQFSFLRDGRQNYEQWLENASQHTFYTSISNSDRSSNYYAMNLDYLHNFGKRGHELTGQIRYNSRGGDGTNTNELLNLDQTLEDGRKTIESGPEDEMRIRLDYTLPLGGDSKFESGYRTDLENSDESTDFFLYNPTLDQYMRQVDYSHSAAYYRNITALYTLYANTYKRFGYQLGLRGEYTFRRMAILDTGAHFKIDRWDYFPSLHTSLQVTDKNQIMTSYSRRIHRPRNWYLEPFQTREDAYTVRTGNPALLPEYVDSYELGYQTNFSRQSMLSVDAYYHVTHNVIERVQSVYEQDVSLQSVKNVGMDYSLGTEAMLRTDVASFWNLSLMGSVYHYRIEGVLYSEPFSRESLSWNARIRNSFKLFKATQIQLNGMYHSPRVSAQGSRTGFFMTNLSFRQDFMDRKFSAILQIRDLLGTGRRESTSEGAGYYNYHFMEREAPVVMLSLRMNINNFRDKQQNRGQEAPTGGEYMPEDGMGEY